MIDIARGPHGIKIVRSAEIFPHNIVRKFVVLKVGKVSQSLHISGSNCDERPCVGLKIRPSLRRVCNDRNLIPFKMQIHVI